MEAERYLLGEGLAAWAVMPPRRTASRPERPEIDAVVTAYEELARLPVGSPALGPSARRRP
ncbi:hypothetical protein [Streptomyces sp. HD]|uniref:hypothetical protein n=1 Tax=Streptomyces sp. HD TaxID=3020892 RepID=UPI00232EF088|nr:hypothetical protein [Streptomyces sp. HD]MDC0767625.1 hypothetical protein [Streptomyces sp. HD]